MNGKAEPRFDLDATYGGQGELQIADYLDWIARGNGRVEVKRKRILDLFFYVETHCDKGRRGVYEPSGILGTTAAVWAFVIGDTGIAVLVPTDLLKASLGHPSVRDKEEKDGQCPTRGRLVNLAALLDTYRKRKTP